MTCKSLAVKINYILINMRYLLGFNFYYSYQLGNYDQEMFFKDIKLITI